ncbi:MAG: FtsX-like permease family protein [Bacteroidota bacterium]
MNLPFFISSRITKFSKEAFSHTISKIAVVTTGLGLAILLIAFMVLFGFKTEIKSKIYSFGGHLIISKYTLSSSYEESPISLSDSLVNQLEQFKWTERFQPYAMKAGLLKTKEEVQGVIIKGVDSRFSAASFSPYMIAGRFPDLSGENYAKEVALSKKIAKTLRLKVDDEVLIFFVQKPPRYRKLLVTGIYETGLEEFDEKIILGDLRLIRRINNWEQNEVGGIELFIKDQSKIEKAGRALFNLVPIDLYVDTITNKYVEVFDWLNLLNRNVVVLLTIIVFVTGTSIISILLILIMERTQMIGILKAMGAPQKLIRSIFLWNGIRLILKGLLWGNVVGLMIGAIQFFFKLIPLDPENYYMEHVPIEFDWFTIIGLNLLILALVGLTLLIPVLFISRVHPVKAIRFN